MYSDRTIKCSGWRGDCAVCPGCWGCKGVFWHDRSKSRRPRKIAGFCAWDNQAQKLQKMWLGAGRKN